MQRQLNEYTVDTVLDLQPQKTVVIADTTFWGKHHGVLVFRSWNLKRHIWWTEVESEKQIHYHYGRKILESTGWIFVAAVIDGRCGLATVFKDIPVQICQFHQIKTVTKYLTRKPKTQAGQELRRLALTLTKSNEKEFAEELTVWEKNGVTFIRQRHTLQAQTNTTTHIKMYAVLFFHLKEIFLTCLPIKSILNLIYQTPPMRLMDILRD